MSIQIGTQIDQYRLDAPLGSGASGEVWRATDGVRFVAVKLMHPALMDSPDAARHLQRFHDEARALDWLGDHAHIPTLYGYNLQSAPPYLIMEYVDSPSWASLLASGEMLRVPVRQRLTLLAQVAAAIEHAHDGGVIHRDVKPANIHGTQHPYLIDFSVSVERQAAHLAALNVGTSLYMPPPQYDAPLDTFHDGFAFALVAYELLFGRHAVFTPQTLAETPLENRQRMGDLLQSGTWHKPSSLGDADLPAALYGADLLALDAAFEALLLRNDVAPRLGEFVSLLRAAIDNDANAAHINNLPANAVPVAPLAEEDYTLHEVRRTLQDTQHTPPTARRPVLARRKPRAAGWWLTGVLVGLGLLALLMLVVSMVRS